ncbi:hypothetical protein QOZ80_1AG0038460 [Eleusine coracana subsp. coracana]|nr:hypothetical protein QOZ80_1AG0038460 [Eleusine coracana subsp. coracana]
MAPLVLLLVLLLSSTTTSSSKRIQPKFSAIFYFGDSILDTGNNNHIPTVALANHVPYGRDFPGKKPTGRFSNGRLLPDLLNERLQLKEFSPPFLDKKLSSNDIMTGVNFASAGSGFDDQTSQLSNTLPMSKQVDLFKDYLSRLRDIVGDKEASRIVANSLIFISSGTNDFSHFYRSSKRRKMDINDYQDVILRTAQGYVKEIFDLGGRQFSLASLPPFGCTPIEITLSKDPDRACVDEQNWDAQVYNSKLRKLLPTLQGSLHGSKIVYIDAYKALTEIIEDHTKYGFTETTRGCCGTGLREVALLCNALTPMCKNVSSYVFYDAVHPTERVFMLVNDYIVKDIIPQF